MTSLDPEDPPVHLVAQWECVAHEIASLVQEGEGIRPLLEQVLMSHGMGFGDPVIIGALATDVWRGWFAWFGAADHVDEHVIFGLAYSAGVLAHEIAYGEP